MSTSRRQFLIDTASSLAALRFGGAAYTSIDAIDRIGVQLYTVRSEMQKSVESTLTEVAKVGYKEVEFAGYFGKKPQEIRALLDANGLTAPSSHSGDIGAIRNRWTQTLEEAATMGHRYLVCASIPGRERGSVDGWKSVAALFNAAGETARRFGIQFGFHNHAEEFAPVDNTTGYDLLLAETDPALVRMQLDLFWIVRGGKDPLAYFAKHPRRFFSVHVKDMAADQRMADVGAGTLPFAKYLARAKRAGVQHFYVEHDNPPDPFASIRASHDYLKRLRF